MDLVPQTTAADLQPGHHLCSLYETEQQRRALLTPYLRQGLERAEKVLVIEDAPPAVTAIGYLRDDGFEVDSFLASGQLKAITSVDSYLRTGFFDPDTMIPLLRSETERALNEGYKALRVAAEMAWALWGLRGSERLIEYEAAVNTFFPGSKCIGLCQYDRRRFPARVLLNVLHTHPIAAVGAGVFDNFYYVPPEDFLGDDATGALLWNCLKSLAVRRAFEIEVEDLREQLKTATEERIAEHRKDREALEAKVARCKQLEEELRRLTEES